MKLFFESVPSVKRQRDSVRELSNGDLVIKYTDDDIEMAKRDDLLVLQEVLSSIDTHFVGEQFSLGNFSTGIMLYNGYSDLVYTLDLSDINKLNRGEEVTLYAREPDEEEKEYIETYL